MNDVEVKAKSALEPLPLQGEALRRETVEMILGLRMFEDLETRDAELLARFLKPCRVREETVVFHEGDEGDFMGFIVDGGAEITKEGAGHRQVKLGEEGIGRMLGEMAMVDTEPRSATARFVNPGILLVLTKDNFDRMLRLHPPLGVMVLLRLCRVLSQRLRRTTGALSEFLS